jgi:hypothetical protein
VRKIKINPGSREDKGNQEKKALILCYFIPGNGEEKHGENRQECEKIFGQPD